LKRLITVWTVSTRFLCCFCSSFSRRQVSIESFPVALHAANVVMLVADAVQTQVDADAARRAFPAHALHLLQHALGQHAVGGDGDHFRLAMLVRADHHVVQVGAQEGLAAGEGHVEGRVPRLGKDLVPLLQRQVVVGLAPHITGAALAVAAEADADHDREGLDGRPAKGAKAQ
jgi:hypothetical protein